jgi:hypothetical protein
VVMSPEDRAYVASRYNCCLCADCLRTLVAERREEQTNEGHTARVKEALSHADP